METPAQFYRYAVPCAQPDERADIKLQSACRPAARRAQKQHARGGTSKRVIDTGTAFVYYLTWHREKNRGTEFEPRVALSSWTFSEKSPPLSVTCVQTARPDSFFGILKKSGSAVVFPPKKTLAADHAADVL